MELKLNNARMGMRPKESAEEHYRADFSGGSIHVNNKYGSWTYSVFLAGFEGWNPKDYPSKEAAMKAAIKDLTKRLDTMRKSLNE